AEPQKAVPLPNWTEDGRLLLQFSNSERRLYDPATGRPRFPELPGDVHYAFSRDGSRFAYARSDGSEVVVCDAATGRTVKKIDPGPQLHRQVRRGDFVLGDDGSGLLVGNRLFDLNSRLPPLVMHGLRWSGTPETTGDGWQPSLKSPWGPGVIVYNPAP